MPVHLHRHRVLGHDARWTGASSVLGVLAAIGLCAAAGGVLALPALRLRGLYMALATLAFAVLMDSIFFINPSMVSGGSITVGRPDIFGMRFTTDRSFVVLLAIVLALLPDRGGGAAAGAASVAGWWP